MARMLLAGMMPSHAISGVGAFNKGAGLSVCVTFPRWAIEPAMLLFATRTTSERGFVIDGDLDGNSRSKV